MRRRCAPGRRAQGGGVRLGAGWGDAGGHERARAAAVGLRVPRARPPSSSTHPAHPIAPPHAIAAPQFFSDFASAFSKLLELGVPFPEGATPV